MKKNHYFFSLTMIMVFIIMLNIKSVQAEMYTLNTAQMTSEATLLIDVKTGEILYSKNENKILYPASITKVMTALLAIESDRLDETATTSKLARHAIGSRIFLEEGEEIKLENLLYGIMLNSGNDAAIVIAEHLAGSIEDFAVLMTERAKELGATKTNFTNPHGLHDDNHYTTAMDIAKIAKYAMENELFAEIVSTKTLPWFAEWHSTLINTNRLLWEYEGASGIKTGYTGPAQNTLVTTAKRDGMELMVVLLKVNGRENLFKEAQELFNYGFNNYENEKLFSSGDEININFLGDDRRVLIAEDIYITKPKYQELEVEEQIIVNNSNPLNLPYLAGSRIGTMKIYANEELLAEASLLLEEDIIPEKNNAIKVASLDNNYLVDVLQAEEEYESSFSLNSYLILTLLLIIIFSVYFWRNKKIKYD